MSSDASPDHLGAKADSLARAVTSLRSTLDEQTKRLAIQRRVLRAMAALTVLVVATLVIGGLVVGRQVALNRALNTQQNEVLCPLLGLFLASYRPDAQPPDRREFYESAFAKIRRMNEALACNSSDHDRQQREPSALLGQ